MTIIPSFSKFTALFAIACMALQGECRAVPLDTGALATLAVQDHGRKKPFTTFAREMLLVISGRDALPVEGQAEKLSAEEVMLDLWLKPAGWDERPVILLTYRDLKTRLGFPRDDDKKLFTYKELIGQQAFLDLLDETQKVRQTGKPENLTDVQREAEHLGERLRLFQECVNGQKQAIVPHPTLADGRWLPIQNLDHFSEKVWPRIDVGTAYYMGDDPRVRDVNGAFNAWLEAYRSGDIGKFNSLTPPLVQALAALAPAFYPAPGSLKFEHDYMALHPFRLAWITYLIGLTILLLTALSRSSLGYRLTWLCVLAGLAIEVYGFACRIIISGRPPVTNLYETVIWVSFCAMIFAVILEAIYRKRYFFYAGLPASILTLIIADSQPTILDSAINPLTAVLRNNMWLTIHVLTIVSSYAAFVLTAALGHIALMMSLRGERWAAATREVQFFIYRAMQIGILLLAAGTILGGVWANYSWGRFWDWDPKETWALVTLLCYLALLHGRLAGWWGGFGLAVGSVVCFLSVVMSWYGVNFILGQNGKSLHSYGLSTGGFGAVEAFALFEVLFVAFVLFWTRRQVERKA